jgi:hypothetical protein
LRKLTYLERVQSAGALHSAENRERRTNGKCSRWLVERHGGLGGERRARHGGCRGDAHKRCQKKLLGRLMTLAQQRLAYLPPGTC